MTFAELFDEVKADIPDATIKQVLRGGNRVIQQINRRIIGVFVLDTAYTSSAAATGYSWDSTNFELTLNTYVKSLYEVYIDKQKYRLIEYNALKNLSSGYFYALKDRDTIVFPSDVVSAATNVMYLEIYKKILEFADFDRATSITIPAAAERVLIDGVLTYLLKLPKLKDDDLYKSFKEDYDQGLQELDALESSRYTPIDIDLEYEY